ncbi:MAG: glycosyltransferase [Polaribacter sp.]|uniref:glycosyltransferase n=1 Tax=Polaribacter sp. TaxID=1920175 RepID=UPI003265401C
MRFLIISDAPTLKKENKLFAYAPYVNEMKLWLKYFNDVVIVSPTKYKKALLVDEFNSELKVFSIPSISLTSFFATLKSILVLPLIFFKLFINMFKADHIHIRNPGSIALIACVVQIFFPFTPKTSKYAGNWDPKSKQPLSYRIQKWILSNTFLTRNCKVLVYGEWENQSKNIIPFFTASYYKNEIEEITNKDFKEKINLIFVGALSTGKQPLLSVKTAHRLINEGYKVCLNIYGDGVMRSEVEKYITTHQLKNEIILHGNVNKDVVKRAFQNSHFLIFISKSEGWPKVVAEAMFWKCLPISSNVSCVSYMLGKGKRGTIVDSQINDKKLSLIITDYLYNEELYIKKVNAAQKWSHKFTLEKFESEIKKLLV